MCVVWLSFFLIGVITACTKLEFSTTLMKFGFAFLICGGPKIRERGGLKWTFYAIFCIYCITNTVVFLVGCTGACSDSLS